MSDKSMWRQPGTICLRLCRLLVTVFVTAQSALAQESKHFDGQVLVAREAEGNTTGGASHVVDTYEPVAGLTLSFQACYCIL